MLVRAHLIVLPATPPMAATPSVLTDIQALRKLFDSEFEGLVQQAKSHLGDAQSSAYLPIVAEIVGR